jgi:phosphate transport system substrate-binding protein
MRMHLVAELTTLGSLLAVCAAIGAVVGYTLQHLRRKPNPRGDFAITVSIVGPALALMLLVQLFTTPSYSLLTRIPGIFPGSTVKACSVTVDQLPQLHKAHIYPKSVPALSGQTITMSGSSALAGLFIAASADFSAVEHIDMPVTTLDSSQGLRDVLEKRTLIGLSDIFVRDDPDADVRVTRDLVDYQVAIAPFAVIVNDDLSGYVRNLTSQQLADIYSGTITNWRDVGGPDEPITAYNRNEGSGTRINFETYVLGTTLAKEDLRVSGTQGMIDLVAKKPGAIGYASTASLVTPTNRQKVTPLCLDGAPPTKQAIADGTYPFWAFEHAYVNSTDTDRAHQALVHAFLDNYICTGAFQREVEGLGFISVYAVEPDGTAARDHRGENPLDNCTQQG